MLDQDTKRRIDTARDILVGKLPNPQAQVEQITIAMIYKFMDDMDKEAMEFGGEATFFTGEFEKYSWTKIFDPKLGGFEMLALYGEAIVKLNQNPSIPQLFRDIFKNAFLPYRDPETLKMFLKIINEFHYDHSEKLGDAFEYLLSVLGSQGDAGQFRTPRHIIDFMVAIMQPKKEESICDPACGTAGFLISSYKHILSENTKKNKGDLLTPDDRKKLINNFVGYDISAEMVRLSLVNLYLHGFTTPKIFEYDTLTSEDRWGDYFDIILANPPFMTPKGGIRPHKKFAMQANRSEVLFVDYIMEHINPTTGRAAIIVPEGIIFQSATAYKALRKLLVDKNFLYGVISLPAGIFQPYSGVKTSILLLDKSLAKKTDKMLFVKLENDGFGLGAQRKELATSDLPDAVNFIKQYNTALRNDDFSTVDLENLPLSSLIIEKSKISDNEDYILSADRYRETIKQNTKWEYEKLGDVCKTSSGGTPLRSHPEFYENGTIPWLKSGEVAQGYIYNSEEFITEEALAMSSAKLFPVDTVLLAMYGATAGQVGILKFPASTNQAVCGIFPGDKFIPEFLYLILKSKKEYLISQSSGGAQPNISQGIIKDLLIPVPPISIQREIVAKIDVYDKIISGAKQVTENYKPEIDINPEWEMVGLGSICENFDSQRKPVTASDRKEGIYPYYGASGIVDYVDDFIFDDDYLLVSEDGANLLARVTPIAFPISGKVWVNNHAHILKFKNKTTQFYIEIFLNSIDISQYVTGAAQPKLNQQNLNRISVPLPTLPEQEIIVASIEKQQQLVNANKELVQIFEQKIKDEINKLWAE
ncbi:restriction endonuclease subunit S [Arachidicoccus soli]|uniref:site-specific DNA-methyltransferase (adenine-specific) n=1 Tax=Arachidicoccus soli TaxID=2341117 RepID=A0A386HMD2_9BACT|nr:restriction endonuclease subunit S [Arachidicoccus soli]AYD46903.1 restriction endonuclease subunit M/S [Arachidicoccus soli]